jgi:hypothetical protein
VLDRIRVVTGGAVVLRTAEPGRVTTGHGHAVAIGGIRNRSVVGSVPGTDVCSGRAARRSCQQERLPQEAIMSHPPLLLQAIAEQRQAELIGAAERYRLTRAARLAARTRGAGPGHGRRARRALVRRSRSRYVTT